MPWVHFLLDEVDLCIGALDDAILDLWGEHMLKTLELGEYVNVAPFPVELVSSCEVSP